MSITFTAFSAKLSEQRQKNFEQQKIVKQGHCCRFWLGALQNPMIVETACFRKKIDHRARTLWPADPEEQESIARRENAELAREGETVIL